jgi:hypothetical protein
MFFKSCLTVVTLSAVITPVVVLAGAQAPLKGSATTTFAITSAQLSSAVDQNPGGLINFELQDGVNGLSVNKNSVLVKNPGSYLILAAPQVTATKDGGCLDAWFVLNGQDVKNSGVRLCQAKKDNTNVLVSQVVMKLKSGDKIQVKTAGNGAKLDAIQPNKGLLIPSIIFTVLGLN